MQQDFSANNKRIAKNTLLLYGRMLLTMVVSLYTSRVVLNTLGVEDYGIYNVVGGIVLMFAFLNTAMVTSTQRYLTFELGKDNKDGLRMVFSTSLRIHVIIAIIIVILTETVGLWFFYNKMVIPADRMTAGMWVLQLSVITMVVQIMSVPYSAVIVAHENMSVFAMFSLLETVLKLAIVFLLLIGNFDKLILYAILVACVQLLMRGLYTFYCRKHYDETRAIRTNEKTLMLEMGKFAGWNLWGNIASMLMGTGVNMLLNVFFGPTVNAARAVAVQVETTIVGFSNNFLMAVRPQITKLYAQQNLNEMHALIFRSSKFTFLLLYVISLPVMVEADAILTIWLKVVPDYTVQFLRLLLVIMLIDSTSGAIQTAAAATGDVKKYQTIVGGVLLAVVPISYIGLKLGGDPVTVYLVHLFICISASISRLLIVRPMIRLSLRSYFNKVIVRCVLVFVLALVTCIIIRVIMPNNLFYSIVMCLVCVIMALLMAYVFGLTKGERSFVIVKVKEIVRKRYNRDRNS